MPGKNATRGTHTPDLLRAQVRRFVSEFGLLADDRTPCGAPVSPREAHALMLLLESQRQLEAVRQADLAAALGVDKSNVTRLVQRLTRAGTVEQVPSEQDGRARLLRLTSKGCRLAASLDHTSRVRFAAIVANIPAKRHALVLSALSLLNEAVSTRAAEAPSRPEERMAAP